MKAIFTFLSKNLTAVLIVGILIITGLLAFFATPNEDGTRTYDGKTPTYSAEQEKAYCQAKAEIDSALSGANVPQDATSGCEPTDLPQMGSLAYYKVDVSTPTTFYNAVNGKGFNEGYGLQCVAGFKEFMFSLSGRYVAAAGGGAKGYASQQGQIEPLGFKWHAGTSGLQDGDWGIWTVGKYGHVAMYYQGKWFGQNQYASDPYAGNAFNLANVSTNGLAGYYRPNIYKNTTPTPPAPKPDNGTSGGDVSKVTNTHVVQSGDTLGGISLGLGWWTSPNGLYGDDGYAQRLAEYNSIEWRGLIYPGQYIKRLE